MLPVMPANPSCSASFRVLRSIAWLAARRTRRSCQGDFGSHCSVKSRKMTLNVLRHRAAQEVNDVGVAALESGRARRLVGHALEDEPLHAGHLAPVALERLHDDLDAGRRADEPVGPGADRRFLEALVADFLDVLLRHDPARAGRGGAIERHEVGPRLAEHELDPARIDHLDVLDLVVEQLGRAALVALEGELDVLGGDGLAVVELGVLTQHEGVAGAVRRHRPRFGEARRGLSGRHRLHQRVVDRVEDLERRDGRFGLAWIEPARRQGDVERVGDLAFRCRFELRERRDEYRDGRDERTGKDKRPRGRERSNPPTHDEPPRWNTETSRVRPRLLCALQAGRGAGAPPAEARLLINSCCARCRPSRG